MHICPVCKQNETVSFLLTDWYSEVICIIETILFRFFYARTFRGPRLTAGVAIMFEDNVLERDELVLEDVESPQSVPKSDKQDVAARAPSPHQSPAAKEPASPVRPEAAQPPAIVKGRRSGFLHRRPVVSAIGALLLASALGGGYLYLDHAKRFQSTDDAFIAARQSALAPKVSGYVTAVPVTDNEHVAAGGVIARIDDRDYRIALDQAAAQVAAAGP